MYRAARGLYNVPQVISAAHSPQGPSGGQARPAQSASDDAPSRALHMAPRSVAHAACHSPAKRGASAGLYAPPATTFLPDSGPLPLPKAPACDLGQRVGTWKAPRSYTGRCWQAAPACARPGVPSGRKRRSVRVSLQTPNQPSIPRHPPLPNWAGSSAYSRPHRCVCVCVGINYRFVPRVKVMQSAILSK